MSHNRASDRRRSGRSAVESRKRRRWRLQPTLLVLEDRRLLSTYTVNSTGDSGAGNGLIGDLRFCITQANAAGGDETIVFDSTVFKTPQTITLNGTQLGLSDTTGTETITGPAAGVTVSGNNASRVFQVDGGVTASISGLTITGGNSGTYSNGGGLANFGTTMLSDCTVSDNTARFLSFGGGVYNGGTLAMVNCTVSGNSASGDGGGVSSGTFGNYGPTLTMTNCTVSANSGYYGGGLANFGTATLTNTIVAGNSRNDIYAPSASGTNNLIGTGNAGGLVNGADGNLVGVTNPLLAPLANYGGPTQTMALLPGSPAIGAGTSTGAPTTDQRGLTRVGAVDIGAFQSSGFTIAVTSGSGQSASGAFPDPLVATVTAKNPIEPVAGGLVTFTPPDSGATATISGSPAVIAADGTASVTAAPNLIGGSYTVSATAAGVAEAASFSLTNYAVVSIAVSPGNPSLAMGVSGQFSAVGTFADGSTQNITDAVAWASRTPSVATISSTGVASAMAVGTSQITASLTGVTSPDDTLNVIAPSFVVNTTADAFGFYTGTTSLREAIEGANLVPGQTITFDKKVFETPQTITLDPTLGQLELSDTTGTETIRGPKAGVTVDAGGNSRVFQVDGGVTASISGTTITGGGNVSSGGGLLNLGTATLTGCSVTGNAAGFYRGYGGGVANYGTATLTGCSITGNSVGVFRGSGGGLFNRGTATLTNCTISGNSATFGGGVYIGGRYGGLPGTATLTNCTISGNSGAFRGGGLWNGGTTTLINCTVSENSAGDGGGVSTEGSFFFGKYYGATMLTHCTVSGNTATGRGGGLYNDLRGTTTLTKCSVTGNSAGYGGGGLTTYDATATLTNCTVSGNSTTFGYGGGVFDGGRFGTATLANCTISGNSSGGGGGLSSAYGATATLTNCTVSGNTAARSIITYGHGGGLYNKEGTTTLTNSTVSGNSAVDGGGVFTKGYFGFFGNYYAATTLTNCTVSGNTATGKGGGLCNSYVGKTTLTGTTVKGNSAVAGGGISNQGMLNVASSNIINNQATSAGGGISTTGDFSSATITDSVISKNGVDSSGTALGGGIDCENSTLSLTDCKVKDNEAEGATALGGGIYALNSTVDVRNSTVNGNRANGSVDGEGGGIYAFNSTLTLTDTKVKGNKATTAYDDIFDGP